MKTFKFYLILLLALILIQCNVKTINQPTPVPSDEETVIRELMDEQEDIVANQPIAMAANMPEENDTILIEVKNYESNLAMGEVKIEVKRDDITISNTTTDNKGEAIVSNVNATNEYIFSKENFSSQRISFVDFNTIDRINVYLKPQGGNSSDSTNVSGFVYNKEDIIVFNFGKHKGTPVKEVLKKEIGYYGWMMNGDFPLSTKKILKEIKESL